MKIKITKTMANILMAGGIFTLLVADNMLVEALGCFVAGIGCKIVDALNVASAEERKETIDRELTKLNFTIDDKE